MIKEYTEKLEGASKRLNKSRDALNLAIKKFDEKLKELNIGVACWVLIMETDAIRKELGYCKLNGRWGISIRILELPKLEPNSKSTWLFQEGPSWLRIEAVGKLPELFKELAIEAERQIKVIDNKTKEAEDILKEINETV